MKKYLTILGATALFFTAAIIISCEGPAGPQGEIGPQGATGPQGEQGIQGADGTATCVQCHDNSQVNFAKTWQWEASVHATGGNFERNGKDCAPCHTSQGFLEANAAGKFATAAPGNQSTATTIANPNPQNCYTCHKIHSTYTTGDWDRTKTTATKGWHSVDGTTMTSVDLGEGNMCSGCHQARALSNVLDMTDDVNTITASSYRWGVHHGPQYNIFVGEGLYEFAGSTTYPTTARHVLATTDGCVDCHMGPAYGSQAGGHTFNMAYEYHGSTEFNFSSTCSAAACHGGKDIVDDLAEPKQVIIEDLLVSLATALEQAGVKEVGTGYLVHTPSIPPITHEMLAAFTNWQAIEEDRSMGLHNFPYCQAVLLNTLEVVFGITP